MAKNSVAQIQKDEQKIIKELLKNANKSINEVAKTCNFSRQKVWRIIKTLEKNNTIWGYTAVVDEEKLEKKGYVILIKRTNKPVDKQVLDSIISRYMEEKADEIGINIRSSIYTNGIYDFMICIEADSIKNAKKFCENLTRNFSGFIQELHLLDKMFSIKKSGLKNPNVNNLRELFDL